MMKLWKNIYQFKKLSKVVVVVVVVVVIIIKRIEIRFDRKKIQVGWNYKK